MNSQDGAPKLQQRRKVSVAIAVAALAVLLGLIWLAISERERIVALLEPAAGPSIKATAGATEPWPTIPATFTPSALSGSLPARTPSRAPTRTPPPTATPIMPPAISDITQILEVNFIRYKSTAVVEAEEKSWWRRDWVVLMAVGYVRVGFDLSQGAPRAPEVNGTNITLVLPHAKVTSVSLLPGESKVIDSKQALFFSKYPGLELEASEAARAALMDAGQKETMILGAAETIAKEKLTGLCKGLGYTKVVVKFEGEGE